MTDTLFLHRDPATGLYPQPGLFGKTYRITTYGRGKVFHHRFDGSKKLLVYILCKKMREHSVAFTLYQTGPFFLPEREMDCYFNDTLNRY